jgi:outer membrane biosynthesis protein TonB
MNKKSAAIAGCYELSDNKDLSSMTIEFEVGMDGRVSGERVADAAVDDVLRDCVLGVVRDARFPKSGAATDVSWPLRFRSRN